MTAGPAARIDTDLPALLRHITRAFRLGDLTAWSVLTTGYEDCNIKATTTRATAVVKIFAAGRAADAAARTVDLIRRARAAGVHHPPLHRDRAGELVHHHSGHQIVVMDFVPGATLYDLRRAPNQRELADVIDQAVRIHAIDAAPAPVFDPWAITNLEPLAAQTHALLDTDQRHLVAHAVAHAAGIDRNTLPAALIHADLTKGNVLVTDHAGVAVLDFAVANRLPRVQELAVIAANLTHSAPDPLPVRVDTIAELYSFAAPIPLTPAELTALRAFAHAAAAMEMLGALAEWHNGNHSRETSYLIGLGLAGLRDYAALS